MDRVAKKTDWTWMQHHMPGVVAMVKRERDGGRGAVVNECWRRGVVGHEPGWFYAAENGVTVGVPSVEFLKDPNQQALAAMFPKRALLMLNGAMTGGDDGAH